MRRELETLDDFMHQAGLRTGGKATAMPNISRGLKDLCDDNKLNLLKKTDRDRLGKYLDLLISKAPVLHFSFASEPSGKFMSDLTLWLRKNIHPQIVVSIGLQPSITAGCVVRTANKQFDFSMREAFQRQGDLLAKTIQELSAADPPKQDTPPPSAAAQLQEVTPKPTGQIQGVSS
jgi:hypothetical protein